MIDEGLNDHCEILEELSLQVFTRKNQLVKTFLADNIEDDYFRVAQYDDEVFWRSLTHDSCQFDYFEQERAIVIANKNERGEYHGFGIVYKYFENFKEPDQELLAFGQLVFKDGVVENEPEPRWIMETDSSEQGTFVEVPTEKIAERGFLAKFENQKYLTLQ